MLFDKIQLEPDEKILKMVRKHWFIITIELLGVGFALLVPAWLLLGLSLIPDSLSFISTIIADNVSLFIFGSAAWMLLTLMTGFAIWTHYYLDLWVITDRRIILIDQISFFNRNVSIFRLERMQDIEFKISGIIATLLNFGTLKAQTAGAHESNFTSTGLPDPRGLQAIIQKAMDKRLGVLHIEPDGVAQRQ